MKINVVNAIWWVVFIMVQLLIAGFIVNNMMQCPPCEPGLNCPWCISDRQIMALWTSAIIGVPFIIWQWIRYFKAKK